MTFLSYEHNCLIYNAIVKNKNPFDDSDVLLLQRLRSSTDDETVIDYYNRSAQLISKINEIQKTDADIWNRYYETYVKEIIDLLRQNKRKEAREKIIKMLDSIESSL